ncbi:MAG: acyl-protein synthetase, partial [Butyrivibrio sp.]|nr:acyl-protein synthetase [Butyrivibrio sp.]
MNLDEILKLSPFSLNAKEKEEFLRCRLLELTVHHRRNCSEYDRILKALGYQKESVQSYKDLPFLPVRLFKELNLKSISDDEV